MKCPRIVRNILYGIAIAVFSVIGFVVYMLKPGKNHYTVSPETTFVTGPLDAEGFIDYVAAINERLRGDIKPEQNANVLIWQAIGPRPGPQGNTMPPRYFELLGSPPPAEKGDYLIDWLDFYQSQDTKDPQDHIIDTELTRITLTLYDLQESPWKSNKEPLIVGWIKSNKKPLEILKKATSRTEYYNPIVPDTGPKRRFLMHVMLDNVEACRTAAILLNCRAMLNLGENRPSEAWDDLICCHRLGRTIQRGGSIFEFVIGQSIEKDAMEGEQTFLEETKLTKALLEKCRNDLDQLSFGTKLTDKVDLGVRFMTLDLIQHAAKVGPEAIFEEVFQSKEEAWASAYSKGRSTDWNHFLKKSNAYFDQVIQSLKMDDYKSQSDKISLLDKEFRAFDSTDDSNLLSLFLKSAKERGAQFGRSLYSNIPSAFNKMLATEYRSRQKVLNLRVAIALAEYRLDHEKYPTTLGELSPKYLAKIPTDLFSGASLKYELTPMGYLLYSVGPNRIDENGIFIENDQSTDDDVAMRVPKHEPMTDPDQKD